MAELNISERQVGDVTVLDMDGKITIGEGSVALRTAYSAPTRRRQEKDSLKSREGGLHRFQRYRRIGFQLYRDRKEEWPVEASQSDRRNCRTC